MESCVPPGFRFHPTDEELVGYYLKKKVSSQKIDFDVIRDIDLYRIEPWDLQDRCRIGYEEQSEWYFFSHKDKKYPTGTRTNRATMAGFWKATGRDKAVYDKLRLIGMRKTLVFYKGRAPNGQKSDWIMHEYRLETDENGPPQEEGWVVCRAFKKRSNLQTRTNEDWDSSYYYEEHSLDYISTHHQQQQQSNLLCKQEIEVDINMINHPRLDQCIQLPRLESPSLPLIKPPALFSMLEDGENNIIEKVTTDWRALDRFVASQLSQEERVEGEGLCKFAVHHNQDMALLLLQSSSSGSGGGGREQGQLGLDGFLSSSSDCDFDVCILGK